MKSDACSGMNTRITTLENVGGGTTIKTKEVIGQYQMACVSTSECPNIISIKILDSRCVTAFYSYSGNSINIRAIGVNDNAVPFMLSDFSCIVYYYD